MKAATISDLKQELQQTPPARVQELCLRLARFKKENKELLTYLLFEEHDTSGYIKSVKQEMESQFETINLNSVYFIKKSLRKIIRTANKYTRYSGLSTVELELLIFFCTKMKEMDLPLERNAVLENIYLNQLKKIHKTLATLHEDLQYDYRKEISSL